MNRAACGLATVLCLALPAVGAAPNAAGQAPAVPAAATSANADLFRAIRRDDATAVRTALLRGADANRRDELGTPAIVAAAEARAWAAVRALGELKGTDLDAANPGGTTALMGAALHGELAVVQFLVARKAEVNRVGWTALHYAAANGHVEVVRFLLDAHAYIDAESPNRTTPLMMAARQGQPTVVRLLVEEGADPTPRNQAGLTAAAYAKAGGDTKLAAWLTEQAEAFGRKYGVPASR
jgi:ankyrin repeat protein